jgi:hypothetical protein
MKTLPFQLPGYPSPDAEAELLPRSEWPFWLAIAIGGIVLFIVFELIGCK